LPTRQSPDRTGQYVSLYEAFKKYFHCWARSVGHSVEANGTRKKERKERKTILCTNVFLYLSIYLFENEYESNFFVSFTSLKSVNLFKLKTLSFSIQRKKERSFTLTKKKEKLKNE
jgi:hypothetical protein